MGHKSIAEAIGKTYKTIDDNKYMGLDNTICRKRDYFCKAKRVWLSEADVKRKKCMEKPASFDMISVKRCTCLVDAKTR